MAAHSAPMAAQRQFWNDWNAATREKQTGEVEGRQARVVTGWLAELSNRDLDIIDVGCGAGWLCSELVRFGRVTGTDLADEVLARARQRVPQARFVAGDFLSADLGIAAYDVAVSLEVIAHVADQPAFVSRIARLLRPGGHLMLATQNRPVLERYNQVPPPGPGQLRRWVDRHELQALLEPDFEVLDLFSVTPRANRGVMRLVSSRTANRLARSLVGDRMEALMERRWLGWTLMALARRRDYPRTAFDTTKPSA